MKAAMRARDAARLSALRLLLAALQQREVDERVELSDADVVSVVEKLLKQRRESIAQFEKAARTDLAEAEKYEVQVLGAYLPQQMSEAAGGGGGARRGERLGPERHGQGDGPAEGPARRARRHGQGVGAREDQALGLKP